MQFSDLPLHAGRLTEKPGSSAPTYAASDAAPASLKLVALHIAAFAANVSAICTGAGAAGTAQTSGASAAAAAAGEAAQRAVVPWGPPQKLAVLLAVLLQSAPPLTVTERAR